MNPHKLAVKAIRTSPHIGFITPEKIMNVFPSLAIWGIAGAAAFSLLGSDVPIVQKDVLSKVPFVGGYWFVSGKDLEE
ncbi:ubiquinol-cytochrome-c reductase complex subunit-domain-containing protein [Phycomyces blakesleeanus]|uniref:Ubiquinol-cytochrome-c reductase complex subunit-domain-containing protein n=1 Tax=Phycomyces blakesleeanus TaxID=4837 RepID=A0ABR3B4H9_PHYBL